MSQLRFECWSVIYYGAFYFMLAGGIYLWYTKVRKIEIPCSARYGIRSMIMLGIIFPALKGSSILTFLVVSAIHQNDKGLIVCVAMMIGNGLVAILLATGIISSLRMLLSGKVSDCMRKKAVIQMIAYTILIGIFAGIMIVEATHIYTAIIYHSIT